MSNKKYKKEEIRNERLEVREVEAVNDILNDDEVAVDNSSETKDKNPEFARVLQNLNLRTEDNLESDIMCVMPKDAEVEIKATNQNSEFVFVEYKADKTTGLIMHGYCMKKYLSEFYE